MSKIGEYYNNYLNLGTKGINTASDELVRFMNQASISIGVIGICLILATVVGLAPSIYLHIGVTIIIMFSVITVLHYYGKEMLARAYLLTIGPLWQFVFTLLIGGNFGQGALVIGNIIITGVVFYDHRRWLTFLIGWNSILYIIPKVYLLYQPSYLEVNDLIFDEIIVTFATLYWAVVVLFIYVKHYNHLLVENKEQIRQITQSKSEVEMFSKLIAHDLRSPLRHTKSFIKLAKDALETDRYDSAKNYLHDADTGADQMKGLVQDISLITNLKPAAKYAIKKISLDAMIMRIVAKEKQLNSGKAINLDLGNLPLIHGDFNEIEILLHQILSNAIKYNDKEAVNITIWDETSAKHHHIHIQDNGIGIAPEYASTIFNYFEKLHPHTQYKGSGLGLSIARKIARQHNGDLKLLTSSTQGSTFVIKLPMIKPKSTSKSRLRPKTEMVP